MNRYSNPEEYGYLKVGDNREVVATLLDETGLKGYDSTIEFLQSIQRSPEHLYINMNPGISSFTSITYFDGIFLHEEFAQLYFEDRIERYKRGFLENEKDIYDHYNNGECHEIIDRSGRRDKPLLFNTFFEVMSDKDKFISFICTCKGSEYGTRRLTSKTIKEVYKLIPEEIVSKRKESKLIDDEGYITVYRGMLSKSAKAEKAMSWTTDIETAEWFGSKFGKKGKVVSGKVHIDDVIFIFEEEYWYMYTDEDYHDNENEVMVMPGKVRDIEVMDLYAKSISNYFENNQN